MAGPTIADLNTFCGEVASPDSSGATALREFMYWINAGLARLYAEHAWNHAVETAKIPILPAESGTKLGATQGSSTITLSAGETFNAKYLSDEWVLHADADSNQTFRLSAIDTAGGSVSATLINGDLWVQPTQATGNYTWRKNIYPLPSNAKEVYSVRILDTRDILASATPKKYDEYTMEGPKETGYPRFYTLRNDKIEIWPAPDTDYRVIAVTFRKGPPSYTTATDTATEVDWPIEWQDLLQKAIQLEASITLGEVSPIKYDLAKMEFEERLANYKSLDSSKDTQGGPMQLSPPTSVTRGRIFYDYGYGDGPLQDL